LEGELKMLLEKFGQIEVKVFAVDACYYPARDLMRG